jgi:hypothetical protein
MVVGHDAPLWGDSLQHTVITQLILDHGGLFSSWEPYAPYSSFTVQYGFSAAAAVFAWATGLPALQAVLLAGQLVGALAVLAIYPLALRLSDGNRAAALAAVLLAGLVAPTPALYVSWGRYAQLIGLAILPAALWLLWEALDLDHRPRTASDAQPALVLRVVLLAALAAAGMTLGYYRMPFFYATFAAPLLLFYALPSWGRAASAWATGLLRLLAVGLLTGLLLAPWAWHSASGRLGTMVQRGVTVGQPAERILADYLVWRDLALYISWPLLLLALAALAWGIVRWQRSPLLLGAWLLLLASLVLGRFLRLPFSNMIPNFAIVISLYLPAALLAGYLIGRLPTLLARPEARRVAWLVPLAASALALLGIFWQLPLADRTTYGLLTRPDLRAMAWLRDNTPPDSRFLVQGFLSNGGVSAVGADGGWWLPLLAGRQNSIPPEYALLSERPSLPGYSRAVIDLVATLQQTSIDSKEGVALLCEYGLTHVYHGQRQGRVGYQAQPLFDPDDIEDSGAFQAIYREDGVRVFALDQRRCQ